MRCVRMVGALTLLVVLAACGSDESDSDATGGSGGGAATGGSGGGGESWEVVQSCDLPDQFWCMTFECDANAGIVCENMRTAAASSGCALGAVQTIGAACTKDKSIGTCHEAVTGSSRSYVTNYEGNPLTAAEMEESCTHQKGTWTVP